MIKKLMIVLIFILFTSVTIGYDTDFKDIDTLYKGVLQSNDVKDVFAYNTSEDNIVSPLWKHGGNIGKCAMEFDGTGDYVSISPVSDYNFEYTDPFSVSIWFDPSSEGLQTLIQRSSGSPGQWFMRLYDSPQKILFRMTEDQASPTSMDINYNFSYVDTGWHHAVLIYHGNKTMEAYVDGEIVGSITDNTIDNGFYSSAAVPLGIGVSGANSLNYTGAIDEVNIFNKSLSNSEVSILYERGLDGMKSNYSDYLIGAWGFDDCVSSGTTKDESVNSNDGTLNGNPVSFEKTSWYKEGLKEKALALDYETGYMEIENYQDYDFDYTDSFSVISWFISSEEEMQEIVQRNSGYSGNWFIRLIGNQNPDELHVAVTDSDGDQSLASYTGDLVGSGWHQAVLVYHGNKTVDVYLDGEYKSSDTDPGIDSALYANTGSIKAGIGSGSGGYGPYQGMIDDTMIINRSLNSNEIYKNYIQGIAHQDYTLENDEDLIGYWNFDDENCIGNRTECGTDLSSEGNDGILTGTARAMSITTYDYGDGLPKSMVDSAMSFDGVTDYFDTGKTYSGVFNDSFTISFWANMDSIVGGQSLQDILGTESYIASKRGLVFRWSATRHRFVFQPSDSFYYSNLEYNNISTQRWYHLVGTYNLTSGLIKFYVNGKFIDSDTISGGFGTSDKLKFGNIQDASREFKGEIDEVLIYSREFTESEIDNLYYRGLENLPTNLTSDLEGYWPFDGHRRDLVTGDSGTTGGDPQFYGRTGTSEFPDKAYLVATDEGLDIVDSRDDSLWMRFVEGTDNLLGNTNFSSIVSLNGKNYLGSEGGLYSIDLIEDEAMLIQSDTDNYLSTISERSNAKGYTDGAGVSLVHNTVNDVSAAYIDGEQYVAVATDGGASIINEDDNTVYDDSTSNAVNTVMIANNDSTGDLYYGEDSVGLHYKYAMPTVDFSPGGTYTTSSIPNILNNNIEDLYATNGTSSANSGDNTIFVAQDNGVTVIDEYQGSESSGTLIHYFSEASGTTNSTHKYILNGDSDNATAITAEDDASKMYVATYDNGISRVDLSSHTLNGIANTTTTNSLLSNNIIALDIGSTLYGTLDSGAGLNGFDDPPLECTDLDGDGYGVCPNCNTTNGCTYDGNDCNDTNSSIYPGAAELCNGVDDNCNGTIDENEGHCTGDYPYCNPVDYTCVECVGDYHCLENEVCTNNQCEATTPIPEFSTIGIIAILLVIALAAIAIIRKHD